MSVFSNAGNATLGEIVDYLRTLPPDMPVAEGFGSPHSYRGYYEDLAFSPVQNTTVREMLAHAESAIGQTFTGYKGGDYTMTRDSDCWLAEYGSSGVPIVLPTSTNFYVLPKVDD